MDGRTDRHSCKEVNENQKTKYFKSYYDMHTYISKCRTAHGRTEW